MRPRGGVRRGDAGGARYLPQHPPPAVVADFTAGSTWHRDNGLWAIDTANPNSWDGAKRYIEASAADIVAIQEIKLRKGEPILTAQGAARRMGWQLSVEECQVTECGYSSAGVGIAVRSHLGMAAPPHRPRRRAARASRARQMGWHHLQGRRVCHHGVSLER